MKHLKRIFETKSNFDLQVEEIEDYFLDLIDEGFCKMMKNGFGIDPSANSELDQFTPGLNTVLFKINPMNNLEDNDITDVENQQIFFQSVSEMSARLKFITSRLAKAGYQTIVQYDKECIFKIFVKIKDTSVGPEKFWEYRGDKVYVDAKKLIRMLSNIANIEDENDVDYVEIDVDDFQTNTKLFIHLGELHERRKDPTKIVNEYLKKVLDSNEVNYQFDVDLDDFYGEVCYNLSLEMRFKGTKDKYYEIIIINQD